MTYFGPSPDTNSHQAQKSQNKTRDVFFHAAFDFDAPRPQNTTQKSKKITKKWISEKIDFQKTMKNGFEPITRCSFSC